MEIKLVEGHSLSDPLVRNPVPHLSLPASGCCQYSLACGYIGPISASSVVTLCLALLCVCVNLSLPPSYNDKHDCNHVQGLLWLPPNFKITNLNKSAKSFLTIHGHSHKFQRLRPGYFGGTIMQHITLIFIASKIRGLVSPDAYCGSSLFLSPLLSPPPPTLVPFA